MINRRRNRKLIETVLTFDVLATLSFHHKELHTMQYDLGDACFAYCRFNKPRANYDVLLWVSPCTVAEMILLTDMLDTELNTDFYGRFSRLVDFVMMDHFPTRQYSISISSPEIVWSGE